MSQYTSSARQLFNILKEAKQMSGQGLTSHAVWDKVLSTKSDEDLGIPEKISLFCELINNVRKDASGIENINPKKYLKAVNEIQSNLLSQLFVNADWNNVRHLIDEKNLDLIESCGEAIEARSQKFIEISPDELIELKEGLRRIIDKIAESNLEKDVKSQIVFELRKIEEAILTYSIRGTQSVVYANEKALGRFFSWFPKFQSADEQSLMHEVIDFFCGIAAKYRDFEALQRLSGGISQIPDLCKDILNLPPSS
jgi:hypothetical protein